MPRAHSVKTVPLVFHFASRTKYSQHPNVFLSVLRKGENKSKFKFANVRSIKYQTNSYVEFKCLNPIQGKSEAACTFFKLNAALAHICSSHLARRGEVAGHGKTRSSPAVQHMSGFRRQTELRLAKIRDHVQIERDQARLSAVFVFGLKHSGCVDGESLM